MVFGLTLIGLSVVIFVVATIAPFDQGMNHVFYWALSIVILAVGVCRCSDAATPRRPVK